MLVYSDESTKFDGAFDPLRCNAVKSWASHYRNSLYLGFMLANGTTLEKHQASKELAICERKMRYWERQPHFNKTEATREAERAKREWSR